MYYEILHNFLNLKIIGEIRLFTKIIAIEDLFLLPIIIGIHILQNLLLNLN